ncbi:hypothetical protein RJZ57_005325 [Blastomyces gilchristii]
MSGLQASSLMRDERNICVTNNEMQKSNQPTYMGADPGCFALLNPGPGNTERIGHLEKEVCDKFVPDELDIDDLFDTVGLVFIFLGEAVNYTEKTNMEPATKGYTEI